MTVDIELTRHQKGVIDVFHERAGYDPSLDNPTTLNEKILARKLYDRRPILCRMTDKLEARRIVADLNTPAKPIPLLYSEIFAENTSRRTPHLDPDQFPAVFKPNNKSGRSKVVLRNRDLGRIYKRSRRNRRERYGIEKGEWAYSQIPAGILIEPLLREYHEYKMWCFSGKCQFIQSLLPRHGITPSIVPAEKYGISHFYRNGDLIPVRNKRWESGWRSLPSYAPQLIEIADTLSMNMDFVRVDLMYQPSTDDVWFCEYTLYPGAGHIKWEPYEYDKKFGDLWTDLQHIQPMIEERV